MADDLGPLVGARETGFVEWKPKTELMAPLLEMGLSENSAKRVNLIIIIATAESGSTKIWPRPFNYFILKFVACYMNIIIIIIIIIDLFIVSLHIAEGS